MTGQLFAQAPVQQAAPVIPTQPQGSALAAAMSQPHPLALQTPSLGIPLGTMMQLAQNNPGLNPNPGVNMPNTMDPTQAFPNTDAGNAAANAPPGPGPGMPSAGQPGIFGQAGNWLQGILGQGTAAQQPYPVANVG